MESAAFSLTLLVQPYSLDLIAWDKITWFPASNLLFLKPHSAATAYSVQNTNLTLSQPWLPESLIANEFC